ncbi:hypothetical protein [Citreimonas salinaria]|uniref:Uncharacterized protein n=1 Tax=Citreimonas salinaria TaxID=321339 RepID=A0A1H3NN61_9RHOB|nr:hypothetical protein [Citreimonas salinaria]SDY90342.1 hypothetical protein SAMN05444340_12718 [Citreimonas salinaria]
MTLMILAVLVALPLVLIAWLAFLPAGSLSGFFGAELRAPCEGAVVAAEGDMADFEVPNEDTVNRLGNHVILRCGEADGRAAGAAHRRRFLVRGDRLKGVSDG